MAGASEACRAVEGQVQSADKVRFDDTDNINNLVDLLSAIKTASSACKDASSLNNELTELQSRIKNYEEVVIKGLEWSRGKVDKCSSKEEANKIREMYDNCVNLGARLKGYSATAKGKGSKLNQTIDKASEARAALSTARAMGARIIEKSASVTALRNSIVSQIRSAEERRYAHIARSDSMLGEIDRLRMAFPDKLLPANEEKFNELRGLVATYRRLPCEPDPRGWMERINEVDRGMNARVQDVRRLFGEADNALSSCQNITPADQAVESIEASGRRQWHLLWSW